jgi:hypothetical protein
MKLVFVASPEQYFNFIHDENKLSSNKSDIKDGTRVCLLKTGLIGRTKSGVSDNFT